MQNGNSPAKGRSEKGVRGSRDLEMLVAQAGEGRIAISASDALTGLKGLVGIGISFYHDQAQNRFV